MLVLSLVKIQKWNLVSIWRHDVFLLFAGSMRTFSSGSTKSYDSIFRISAYLCNTNQKMCRFSRKMKGDEKILCMVSDSVLAKRRRVAVVHQIQGLSQTVIIRKHKYSHRLVQRWMNVPHTAPDTAFGRHPGGGKRTEVHQRGMVGRLTASRHAIIRVLVIAWQTTLQIAGERRA